MKIDDFNLKTFGEGTPIVMLHGFQLDQVSLIAACEPILEKKPFKRVYFDMPGMGFNQNVEGIINADHMIDVLIELIENYLGSEPFLLLGMSYGGYLARAIAHKMPHRCLGIFLLVPVVYPKFSERTLPEHEVVFEDFAYTSQLEPHVLSALREGNVVITEAVVKRQNREIDEAIARGNQEFLDGYQQQGYQASFDVDNHAATLDAPVMIVAGKQDSVVGYEDQYQLSKRYKRASYTAIHGAGHGLHYDQEKAFNSALETWISGVTL